jgi:glycosyltransferase involved in cell wall biosynthesis
MSAEEKKLKKISIFLPSIQIGGAERLSINLANEWSASGYDVEIVSLFKEDPNDTLISLLLPQVKLVQLNISRLLFSVGPLVKYLKSSKSDVLLAAMWPLTIICITAWIFSGKHGKLFISEHTQLSVSIEREIGIPRFLLSLSIYIFYKIPSGIITVSNGVRDDICILGSLKKNKIQVIYNPASTLSHTSYIQTVDPFQGRWTHTGFKLLAVGTLKEQKDFTTLIQSVNEVAANIPVSLIILGEGPERARLESLSKSLGISEKISLPGYVVDTAPYFNAADLFILSSAWEGFGNVLVEALECGTPVISTNCKSGPSAILENGKYGKLVPVKDYFALARGIEEMLAADHDTELLKKRAEFFSVERIALQYIDYFNTSK